MIKILMKNILESFGRCELYQKCDHTNKGITFCYSLKNIEACPEYIHIKNKEWLEANGRKGKGSCGIAMII